MSNASERPPSTQPAGKRATRRWLPAAVIVGAALLVYAPVFRAGFIWDDDTFLTQNPLIHAPGGLRYFWFTKTPADYFPLTASMLWFEWRLWGPNPLGYHLVNVLLHAASAVLLWRVLLRLRIPGAWLAGLLFAVHPVAVESVAWITERKNLLPMALYLASLLAYLRYEDKTRADRPLAAIGNRKLEIGNYVLSLVLFLLALLAKTSVVMLPAILLLCAWWRRGKISLKDIARSLPFFALAAALGLVTVWYQYHNAIGGDVVRSDGLAARAAGAGWAAWFYLYKALLPASLCFVYPRWTTPASLPAFVPAILFAGILLLFARFRRGWGRPCLFALGYFVMALLPVLGFLNIYFMKYSLVSDHWQYLALIGPIALVAGFLAWIIERRAAPGKVALAAAGALVLACAALTFRQTLVYHDNETLWRDTLAKNPKAWIASSNLGGLLARQALAPGADSARLYDEAERCCEAALRGLDQAAAPKSFYAETCVNRGVVRAAAKRYAEALDDYDQAIALKPDFADPYINRAVIRAADKRYAEAMSDYQRAIALKPFSADAYYNRGTTYANAGHLKEALSDLNQAIALRPDYAEAYFNRGMILAAAHRYDEALRDLDRVIALQPGNAMAHCNRGGINLAANHYAEAIRDYDQAIARKPDYADAWFSRGTAYAGAGHPREALRDLDRAIALQPDDAQAYCNRGNVHAAANHYAEAIGDYSRAIQINPGYADAYLNRAQAWYTVKDYPRALADVEAARCLGQAPNAGFLRALNAAAGTLSTAP